MSQTDRIIQYLATGRGLTPLTAPNEFGTLRLSQRIIEAEQRGVPIRKEWYVTSTGARVMSYWWDTKHGR